MNKEVKNVENNDDLMKKIKEGEKKVLAIRFGNCSECSDFIAKNKKGNLVYEINNNEEKKELVNKVKLELQNYVKNLEKLLVNHGYDLNMMDRTNLIKSIEKIQQYCLNCGFYSKALKLGKILKNRFGKNQIAVVEKALEGYGIREIKTGVNQSRKISLIVKSTQMGEYGAVPKYKSKFDLINCYKNAKVKIGAKEFTLADSKNAISTM